MVIHAQKAMQLKHLLGKERLLWESYQETFKIIQVLPLIFPVHVDDQICIRRISDKHNFSCVSVCVSFSKSLMD